MKTLHILSSIDKSSGGPARSVPKTCEYLSKLDVCVELLSRQTDKPVEVKTSSDFKLYFLSFFELIWFGLTLRKNEISLIHLQHIWDPYIHVMARMARLKNIPYLVTPRGMLEPWIMNRNKKRKRLGLFLYQRNDLSKATCIHATCEAEMVQIRKLGFTNPIALIPNGIDLSVIPYTTEFSNSKKIVFISRIHEKKGIELLLDAWNKLNLKDWTLEIAGEGQASYLNKIKKLISVQNIPNVRLVGSLYGNEKWTFLQSAELMILPTYSENFGIVVAEALAVGIPVITTKDTPWRELETENCGWWIDLSVRNIIDTIQTATSFSVAERAAMGKRGRELIKKKYDIQTVAERIKILYAWMLGNTSKPEFVFENTYKTPQKNDKLKIIHFITSIDKSAGGTTVYLQLLSQELKKLVELIVISGTSNQPVEIEGVDVRFLNISLYRWFKLENEFKLLLQNENPDIVHINGIWLPQTFLFQQVAQQLGIKVVLSPHGMLEQYILDRHSFKKMLALAFYQRNTIMKANFLHATAQSELDQIHKLGYMQPASIIPNGIEIKDIKQKTEWKSITNILFLSRVHPKKGLELLIEAVAQLPLTNFKIKIAGEGDADYIQSLKKLANQKKVSERFDFVGGVYGNQKWELYNESDLFILPTYSENFGIVVAEALSTGLPVITTTGTPWLELETEKCGWWVDLNVPKLVKALTEAIQLQPEELKAMALRGRELVKEKYEIKAVALQMKEFYNQVIN